MMTKTLPTFAIQNGDIVQAHGCRFRVSKKRHTFSGMHCPVDVDGCAFSTEYVGPVTPDRDPIGEHGGYYGGDMVSGRWVIQGNARATWTVEVYPSRSEYESARSYLADTKHHKCEVCRTGTADCSVIMNREEAQQIVGAYRRD